MMRVAFLQKEVTLLKAKFNRQKHFVLPGLSAYKLLAEAASRMSPLEMERSVEGFGWVFTGPGHLVEDRFDPEFWPIMSKVCSDIIGGKITKIDVRGANKRRTLPSLVDETICEDTLKGAKLLQQAILARPR